MPFHCLVVSSAGPTSMNASSTRSVGFSRALRRTGLALAASLFVPLAHAQSNYATPYFFITLAGSPGLAGEVNGTGSAARFNFPYGVTVDTDGVVYVADFSGNTVRRITAFGQVVTQLTYSPSQPISVATNASGNLYVADYGGNAIIRTPLPMFGGIWVGGSSSTPGSANGTGTTARFFHPAGVAVDSNGNIYVGDEGNHLIRKITPSAVVSTLAGLAGNPGSSNGNGTAARFNLPRGVAVDVNLNVYVADYGNHTIRKITPTGDVTTLAGLAGTAGSNDGTGAAARFRNPHSVAVDSAGSVYVADVNNHLIRKISSVGEVTTLAGLAGSPGSPDGLGSAARFNFPTGVAVDTAGILYVADSTSHTIRMSVVPPSIGTQPAAQVVLPGGTATFSASATSNVPITYQWRKDEVAIPGATATTLTVSGAQTSASGNFTLVATNVAGSTTSNAGVLSFVPPPSFTTQPTSQTAAVGATASFTAAATGAGLISYQWLKDGAPLSGATTGTLIIPNVQTANLGTYSVIAANGSGPTVSNPALLAFTLPPSFTLQPSSQSVAPGATATFTTSATGTGLITYQWLKDGAAIPGATTTTLTVPNVQSANLGNYLLIASNAGGPTTSNVATLAFPVPPSFATQPASQSVPPGANATFAANATSGLPLTYQWQKNGVAIPGATTTTLTLTNVQVSNLGSYTLVATNSVGPTTSNAAALTFNTSTAGRLTNLSIRTNAGTGAQTLIVGFVVGGADTSGPKPLLIRGAGPTLAVFGVPGFLPDPALSVFSGATVVASNDNWNGDAQVTAIGTQVGAFAFGAAASRDAAFYSPALNAGAYTVQITGVGGTTGITLAEIYDATPVNAFLSSTPRLVNVSARTQVGTGADILITGFNIGGTTAKTLLIRAVGPALGVFGVTGFLVDPKLDLLSGSAVIQSNDNWGGTAAITAAAASVGAFALDAASRDAVLLVTLQPGSYTAQVTGVGNTTGVALVEIYEVP